MSVTTLSLVFAPIDPIAMTELIGGAALWVAESSKGKRGSWRKRSAAVVLQEAGVLIAALHAIDKGARQLAIRIARVDPSLERPGREDLFDQVAGFYADPVLPASARRAHATLSEMRESLDAIFIKPGVAPDIEQTVSCIVHESGRQLDRMEPQGDIAGKLGDSGVISERQRRTRIWSGHCALSLL